MTVLPASALSGRSVKALTGTLTTTRSPASAACSAEPAVASGPSSAASSASVSGPRELLTTTRYPAATLSRATVPPIIPLPMMPTVVMTAPTPEPIGSFRSRAGRRSEDDLGSDPPPDHVRLAWHAFGPVAKSRAPVVSPGHLEHARVGRHAFDPQARPERAVGGHQIGHEGL